MAPMGTAPRPCLSGVRQVSEAQRKRTLLARRPRLIRLSALILAAATAAPACRLSLGFAAFSSDGVGAGAAAAPSRRHGGGGALAGRGGGDSFSEVVATRQHGARTGVVAASAAAGSEPFLKKYFNDNTRNTLFIVGIIGTVGGSWWYTGKWWKIPLMFALPSMLYRLWSTRGDTTKLAEVSASVDMKYVATSEKEKKELHMWMCSGCGYTLFPARGREAAFFTDNFKCPMCGATKEEFFDMNEDDDAPATAAPEQLAS